ncbi:MAG: HPr family phosphocarrier protein [Deltaproteobacteria bacterium]|nr:HPr family phosphocarrier protein [Deltaproteobacteria bacterium]
MHRVRKRLEIKNRLGMHARASALLVQTVNQFAAEVKISKDDNVVNARSIMGVLTLGAAKGAKIRVETKGEDAQEAMLAIEELIEDKFRESD